MIVSCAINRFRFCWKCTTHTERNERTAQRARGWSCQMETEAQKTTVKFTTTRTVMGVVSVSSHPQRNESPLSVTKRFVFVVEDNWEREKTSARKWNTMCVLRDLNLGYQLKWRSGGTKWNRWSELSQEQQKEYSPRMHNIQWACSMLCRERELRTGCRSYYRCASRKDTRTHAV